MIAAGGLLLLGGDDGLQVLLPALLPITAVAGGGGIGGGLFRLLDGGFLDALGAIHDGGGGRDDGAGLWRSGQEQRAMGDASLAGVDRRRRCWGGAATRRGEAPRT